VTTGQWVAGVQAALAPLADPRKAAAMRRYLRDQFAFLGIATPVRRGAVAALVREPVGARQLLARARRLWRLPQREYRYTAIDLLARHARLLGPGDIPALLSLAIDGPWWETVDGLAAVIGDVLWQATTVTRSAQRGMDRALGHRSFWVRRIAMTHQLGWRGHTDRERLGRYALALAPETEFFIAKALGWAMRDYARHDPAWVRRFVRGHGAALQPLTRREALRRLA
jgi:3-methyladenine DNA glycosylase AlkD